MKKLLALTLALLMILAFAACSDKEDDKKDNLDDYVQDDDVEITHVTIDQSTFHFESIDSETVRITAYEGPDSPHDIEIPEKLIEKTVVEISEQAFYYSNIQSVKIPATVTAIGKAAFAGCAELKSVTIPAAVKTIGEKAFYGCTALTALSFATESALTDIEEHTFYGCTKLTEVSIPAYIKTVGTGAFYGCEALATVTVAEGVEVIGAQAFQNCKALASLTLPASVSSIGQYAFSGSESLYRDGVTCPKDSYAEGKINDMNLAATAPAETTPAT